MDRLTHEQYLSTMASKMVNVTAEAEPVLDIWPHVKQLVGQGIVHPLVVDKELVEHVYRSEDGKFDHVLLPTASEEKFIVIVVDIRKEAIYGFYDLNLKEQYS